MKALAITGAAGGIGAAIARRAKAEGFTPLVLMDRNAEGLAAVTEPAALIAAMASHPKLIERPIVVSGSRAAIGRPPEQVLEIL